MTAKQRYTAHYRHLREYKYTGYRWSDSSKTGIAAWVTYRDNFELVTADPLHCPIRWMVHEYSQEYLTNKIHLAYYFNTDFNLSKVARL